MKKNGAYLYIGTCAVFLLLVYLDRLTKQLAVLHLKGAESKVLVEGVLRLTYAENTGAAFSILRNQTWFFVILAAVVGILLMIAIFRLIRDLAASESASYGGSRWMILAVLVLILAGLVGNLICRVQHGYVIDMIEWYLFPFPIFNVADICITFGAVLLFLFSFFKKDFLDLFFQCFWPPRKEESSQ